MPKFKTIPVDVLALPPNIFNRITCNLFGSQLQHNNQHRAHGQSAAGNGGIATSFQSHPPIANILERRTIQSTHISTISSLVDRTKVINSTENSGSNSQRDNYGLYALKCNRSAAKRTGIIMNITSNELKNQSAYEIKHEQFQPCRRSTAAGAAGRGAANRDCRTLNYATECAEFYEFNENGGLRNFQQSVGSSSNTHCNTVKPKCSMQPTTNQLVNGACVVVNQISLNQANKHDASKYTMEKAHHHNRIPIAVANAKPVAAPKQPPSLPQAPIPPHRAKNYIRPSATETKPTNGKMSSVCEQKQPHRFSSPYKSLPQHPKNLNRMYLNETMAEVEIKAEACNNSENNKNNNVTKQTAQEPKETTPIVTEPAAAEAPPPPTTKPPQQSIQKNRSQLFQISESNKCKETLPTAASMQHSSAANVGRIKSTLIKRGSSSDDSINIFCPENKENAFDDFDEVFLGVDSVESTSNIRSNSNNNNGPNNGITKEVSSVRHFVSKAGTTRKTFDGIPGKLSRQKLFPRNGQSKCRQKTSEISHSLPRMRYSLDSSSFAYADNDEINEKVTAKSNFDSSNNNNITSNDGIISKVEKKSKTIAAASSGYFNRNDDYNYYDDDVGDCGDDRVNNDINFNNEIKHYSQQKKYITNIISV